jgi:hypothetical protein
MVVGQRSCTKRNPIRTYDQRPTTNNQRPKTKDQQPNEQTRFHPKNNRHFRAYRDRAFIEQL